MSQLGHYQLGYIETLSHWNQSIDEKHWKHKGQNRYMCVILNFKTMEIVDIIDGRTKKTWLSYTQIIDKKELAKGQSFLTALIL